MLNQIKTGTGTTSVPSKAILRANGAKFVISGAKLLSQLTIIINSDNN